MAEDSKRITLTVSASGAKREFRTPDELRQWVESEVAHWEWLQPVRERVQGVKEIWRAQNAKLQEQLTSLNQNRSDATKYLAAAYNSAVEISQLVQNQRLLTSEDAKGQFVLSLAKDAQQLVVAAFALGYLLHVASSVATPPPPELLQGQLRAELYKLGLRDTAEAQKKALDQYASEYRKTIEELNLATEVAKAGNADAVASFQKWMAASNDEFNASQKTRREAGEAQLADQTKEFSNLKAAFTEQMNLEASYDYWKSSARTHKQLAKRFAIAASIAGVLITGGVVGVAMYLISVTRQINASGEITFATPPYWEVGVFAIGLTLGIWLIRILVKLLLSNSHQRADAEARATMTKSYLALIKEGKLNPDDRTLILATLFRPMTTGIVRDDGMPPSLTELLSKLVGGRGT